MKFTASIAALASFAAAANAYTLAERDLADLGELDNTSTLGTCTLEQDLGELDLTSGLEELDEILIRR